MSTENEGVDVFNTDFKFVGDESAEAGGIEHSGHPDDALARKFAELVSCLRHGIERIRDDDEDAVRRMLDNFADHVAHDFVVGVEEVVAAHAGLAWDSRGDDYD